MGDINILRASIVAIGLLMASAGYANAEAGKAEACLVCHNAALSLNGLGAEKIANQMKVIRAGDRSHPPGLADLSDADIAEIAAYLDGA